MGCRIESLRLTYRHIGAETNDERKIHSVAELSSALLSTGPLTDLDPASLPNGDPIGRHFPHFRSVLLFRFSFGLLHVI